ncbi:auxilin-like protein 1 isoform X2 [Vicia villosa]|uniref:auxilin-like protein 1 isoform X2 n=1 Tax=Vicia villosa TaxID=3911 RepID=UPI00273CA749|nr:auxilin-like protein 1 isoform X2 [Vicia villosa]
MESVTHSRQPNKVTLPKKITNGTFSSTKTLYDDVYGGPPKFTASSISPRFEDYGEIFSSFHAARSSSIPVLDLPAVDAGEVFFDFRRNAFDYAEVFGGSGGLDFWSSHEDLFRDGDYEEEEKAWTSVEADSFSGDLDHFGNNVGLSNGGLFQSVDGNTEFNISFHKVNSTSNEDMSKGKAHITQLHAVPGVTHVVDETTLFHRTGPSLQVVDDIDLDMEFNAGRGKRNHHKKMTSRPCNVTSGEQLLCCDLDLLDGCNRNDSHSSEMFITVSDVSLRTIPSKVPPPCRPPPLLDPSKGYISESHSNSERIDSEDTLGDGSPPFFDVEVDINSSASVVKEATNISEAKVRTVKDLKGRKKRGSESSMKSTFDVKTNETEMSENITRFNSLNDERVLPTCDRRSGKIKISATDERQKARKAAPVIPEPLEGKKHLNLFEEKHMKETRPSQESDQSIGVGTWKEATEFIELVGTEESQKVVHPIKHTECLVQDATTIEHWRKEGEASNIQEEYKKVKTSLESYQPDEYKKKSKAERGAYEPVKNIRRSKSSNVECRQREPARNDDITENFELEKSEKIRMASQHGKTEKKATKANQVESGISKEVDGQELCEVQFSLKLKENEKKLKQNGEQHLGVKKHKQPQIMKENETIQTEVFTPEAAEGEERVKDSEGFEKIKGRSIQAIKLDKPEENVTCTRENEIISEQHLQNRNGVKESCEHEENMKSQKDSFINKESSDSQKPAHGRVVNEKGLIEEDFESGLNKTKTEEAFEHRTNEASLEDQSKEKFKVVSNEYVKSNILEETSENKGTLKVRKQAIELERRSGNEAQMKQETESISNQTSNWETPLGISNKNSHSKQSEKILKDAGRSEKDEGFDIALEQMKVNREYMSMEFAKETDEKRKAQHGENLLAAHSLSIHEENVRKPGVSLEPVADHEIKEARTDCKIGGRKLEEVGLEKIIASGKITSFERSQGKEEVYGTQSGKVDCNVRHTEELCFSSEHAWSEKAKTVPQMEFDSRSQEMKIGHEWGESKTIKHHVNVALNHEGSRNLKSSTQVNTCDDYKRSTVMDKPAAVQEAVDDCKRSTVVDKPAAVQEAVDVHNTSQRSHITHSTKIKEKCLNETLASVEKDAEKPRIERELEKERLRKIEEEVERERERQKDRMAVDRAMLEAEREREREKDRLAVDRATFEARDRAYSEARDRAERAAFDRATAEARQRALTEARERLEKACAEARDKSYADKANAEARLKAERAAVERATAEARERAMEKVRVERAVFGSRERLDRSVSDKFGVSSRNDGRMGSSSSDIPDPQFHNISSAPGSRHPYSIYGASSFCERSEGESAQRCRARLERCRRTEDRAAKALEEKNMRDLLAQKEQAERSRLAETLDTEVRRWSSGKEGNLRALLSTLQYILGPDSGWQPIPLTEVITSAAAKKAYRKATLCVHPDKLQQRGASIQHKYICEKVFDLLKDAWSKFNSEER